MTSSHSFIADSLAKITLDPGLPRLTWYGPDFERIELSGAVLNNWVNKTTNLIVEEFEAQASVEVALDLPPHWRSLTWALATLLTGSTLTLAAPSPTAAVLVTDRPDTEIATGRGRTTDLVAVTLAGLARKYPGELPSGAIDAASAVMTYGDAVWQKFEVDPGAVAIAAGADTTNPVAVSYADLPGWVMPGSPERHLVRCVAVGEPVDEQAYAAARAAALLDLVSRCLGIWAAGGSAVILSQEIQAELASDPDRLARIIASERVTAGN